ncbi:putative F420-0 ABC transporter permease subunit [Gulosibacter chungangensis]|uniref:Iron chelate uptake ABC transporter family permease subunit n=1 Tax=Gulosibacter chungangensis TaxID=979746 RepID=A0A7J5BI76_9MICO|nr:putative F420-0 ABC transporter permease subunit [Gulosibacter chungangensis]KAB1645149.1 iron chelate uptake ABC transporter family permease subunit [Gulosibacter chungangensis]
MSNAVIQRAAGRAAGVAGENTVPATPTGAPRRRDRRQERSLERGNRARAGLWAGIFAALLFVSLVTAICVGPADISPGDVWNTVLAKLGFAESTLSLRAEAIIWELRVPRVLVAATVGSGLALVGVIMQAITRNSLADPYLLGLSSGASLGAVAVLVIGASLALPFAAFLGGALALAATLAIASASGQFGAAKVVLAGVAVSAIASAITSLVIFWSATGDSFREILNWMLGSFAGANWSAVAIALGAMLLIGTPLLTTAQTLNAYTFGDISAASLGINATRTRWMLLLACALLTSSLVSVSGSIGFVGLVMPHAVRLLVGNDHRNILPLSALAGAVFMVWADTAARTLFDPRELPVGIVTAIVGAPIFALILMRKRAA